MAHELVGNPLSTKVRVDKDPFDHDPVVSNGWKAQFTNQGVKLVLGDEFISINNKFHHYHIHSNLIFNKVRRKVKLTNTIGNQSIL